MSEKLTQEYLKRSLTYSKHTGLFTWKARPVYHFKNRNAWKDWNRKYPCTIAGYISPAGYVKITISGKAYPAHRLAFLYICGYIPENFVDHRDMNPTNNKWKNLREVTNQCNQQNCKISIRNKSGITGVSWNSREKKWKAKITIAKKTIYLGFFEKLEDAARARYEEEKTNPLWSCSVTSSAKQYLISIGEQV